jgi:ketosteroid isomerase-like protein
MKSNKEKIQAMYDAFGKGDIPFILDAVSEDFTWTDPTNPSVAPQGGTYTGRNGFIGFFQNLGGSVDTQLWEVDNYLAEADTVVATGKHGVVVKATGKSHTLNWMMIWDFKNGMPVKGRSIFETGPYESCFS